jgi:hypothetical protein
MNRLHVDRQDAGNRWILPAVLLGVACAKDQGTVPIVGAGDAI